MTAKSKRPTSKQFANAILKVAEHYVAMERKERIKKFVRNITPEPGWILPVPRSEGFNPGPDLEAELAKMFPKSDWPKTKRNPVLDSLKHGYFV